MQALKTLFKDVLAQFYPNLCFCCGKEHIHVQNILCINCHTKLPKTNFHLEQQNDFTDRFAGRIPLTAGAALYFFRKGGRTQQLIYQFKYHNQPQIGVELGQYYGRQLKESTYFQDIDCIVPVPLHPKKRRKRGYNQSDELAKGLAKTMELPWYQDGLVRTTFTKTQTKKNRMERFENVLKAFAVKDESLLKGKHVLLVDDVLTTGATLEACATHLLKVPNTQVSMVTLAMGQM